MENNNKNYITAGILILFGLLFLGKEFNLFSFHWGDIARFWPLILIAIGFNLISGGKNSQLNSLLILLCFVAIPFGLVRSCENKWEGRHGKNNWHWRDSDNDNDGDDDDETENDEKNNIKDDDENFLTKSQSFEEDMEPNITAGSLEIKSGVASIEVDGTTNKLFEADTKATFTNYALSKTIDNGKAKLIFNMKDRNIKDDNFHIDFDNDNISKNEAKIRLNANIPWQMDLNIGVSGANLDLSPFAVDALSINTGVSGVDVKLGDKASNAKINIKAGVAGVEIKVPNSAGVRVQNEGFLTGGDFEGFEKRNGAYYSPNYDKATKKIDIEYNGAIGGFSVKRY
jgi:hypothetical protein